VTLALVFPAGRRHDRWERQKRDLCHQASAACYWQELISRLLGVIINNSSSVGTRVKPMSAVYCASKAAVDSLTRSAAIEGEAFHVRVNAIAPGPTMTPGVAVLMANTPQPPPGEKPIRLSIQPPASVEEVARFVVFLCAMNTGRFFNGAILLQDGAMSLLQM
jgi:NAD(P)-dependent dehydrogenase (short-subunit alcohol dehydrogenase family)